MNAVIVAVGDELTSGQTIDTNSAYLAKGLASIGIETISHLTVRDTQPAIAASLLEAAGRAGIVLVTGGLGPTADDLTRQALAEAMNRKLVVDANALAGIEDFFRRRGRKMIPANRIQAMHPEGSQTLDNPVGTAPGIAARLGDACVFVMPGVPREMRKMFDEQVAPRLGPGEGATVFAQVHICGMGESDIGAVIGDLMAREGDLRVGTTAKGGMVTARITARGSDFQTAKEKADDVADEIRRRLGDKVVGRNGEALPQAVGELLKSAGQTLATAESCTGGLIGEMLTDVPGASDYYLGGVVAYANTAKQSLLGVEEEVLAKHGAVSGPVARAMAEGAAARLRADWAIAATGVAGPTGGTQEKPVGLVYLAVAGPNGSQVWEHRFPGDREAVRTRSAVAALNHLRLALAGPSGR